MMLILWLSNSQEIRELSNQDFVSLGVTRAVKTTLTGKSTYTKARTFHAMVLVDSPVIVVFTALMSPKTQILIGGWVACLLACLLA